MGAFGHRWDGVHGVGSGHGAAWTDGRAGRTVRRIRSRARALSGVTRFARALGLWKSLGLLVAGAVLHGPLAAQVRDTIPKRDTLLKKRDTTVTTPVPQRAD